MSATALPLPLALSKPLPFTSDLETAFANSLGVDSIKYNPETQMRLYDVNGTRYAVTITLNNSTSVVNGPNYGIQIDDVYQVDDIN
jgi:hypothetical protein